MTRLRKLIASAVSAFILTLLDDTDAAAARATLGIKMGHGRMGVVGENDCAEREPFCRTAGPSARLRLVQRTEQTLTRQTCSFAVVGDEQHRLPNSRQRGGGNDARGFCCRRLRSKQSGSRCPTSKTATHSSRLFRPLSLTRSVGANLSHTHTVTVDSSGAHTHSMLVNASTDQAQVVAAHSLGIPT